MDKEDVAHIYNGLLLSYKKKWNWVICRDMDGPRECHTEWNKLERERQVSYNNAYMWNLENWYRWSYFQSRNRDRRREQMYGYQGGKVGGGRNWEIEIDTYTLLILCIKYITNENLLYSTGNFTQCSVVTQMGRKSKKEGYMYTYSWFTLLYSRN